MRRAGGGAVGCGGAPREPAHGLSRARWGGAAGGAGAGAVRPRLRARVSEAGLAGALADAAGVGFDLCRSCRCARMCLRLAAERARAAAAGIAPYCRRTGGRWDRCLRTLRAAMGRGCGGAGAGLGAVAGAVCRLHSVAAGGAWARRAMRGARWLAAAWVLARRRWLGCAEAIEFAERSAAACGCEPSRGCGWGGAVAELHVGSLGWRGSAGRACSWCCRRGLRVC